MFIVMLIIIRYKTVLFYFRSWNTRLEARALGTKGTSEHVSPNDRRKTNVRSPFSPESLETEDARKLSTAEPQRLVLLEQLQLFRLKNKQMLRESLQGNSLETINVKSF